MSSGAVPLPEAVELKQILDFVDADRARLDLTAKTIAARMGVQRSVPYRMFEPPAGVSARVQQRRLPAVRRALARADERRPLKRIAEANGFASESQASRSVREVFGQSTGEFRQACRAHAGQAGVIEAPGKAEFARWFMEVRQAASARDASRAPAVQVDLDAEAENLGRSVIRPRLPQLSGFPMEN